LAELHTQKTIPVVIIGAGPAGLSCALTLRHLNPELEICVIDKAAQAGNHTLSGALLDASILHTLLDPIEKDWKENPKATRLLTPQVRKEKLLFCLGNKIAFNILPIIKIARLLRLPFGQLLHDNDYIVSINKLTAYLTSLAQKKNIDILHGFAVSHIDYDSQQKRAKGIQLVDQGLAKNNNKQPNYLAGEYIESNLIVLAEGAEGLVTEKFITDAGLQRMQEQTYSVGIKELIQVSKEQYNKFGTEKIMHTLGYPLWTPLCGPAVFGGGALYPMGKNTIAFFLTAAIDWKYHNFSPQNALLLLKNHPSIKKYLRNGKVLEAGAKMIPEGGLYAIPRDPETGTIGKSNVIIIGDSAGYVNVLKLKGIHNAISSGIEAAHAIHKNTDHAEMTATTYTELMQKSPVMQEMKSGKNFRQTIAKFGLFWGFPLSTFTTLVKKNIIFKIKKDSQLMKKKSYKKRMKFSYDRDTFTALTGTMHREDQPSHLKIKDTNLCKEKCDPLLGSPCIIFCPAEVYEKIDNIVKPANHTNCVHCKLCQQKCPYNNIQWTAPEGGGGPRYQAL
jgi:electron-transferring-flavoprotein dehydrogenase